MNIYLLYQNGGIDIGDHKALVVVAEDPEDARNEAYQFSDNLVWKDSVMSEVKHFGIAPLDAITVVVIAEKAE